jgi:hypothetical protein
MEKCFMTSIFSDMTDKVGFRYTGYVLKNKPDNFQ